MYTINKYFTGIIGQHSPVMLLSLALEQNKIAPAYLFTSLVAGVGKTKTANYFAQAITAGNNLDILHIKPDNSELTSTIRVEQISQIIDFLSTRGSGSNKVIIIEDADKLNATAANKLLKTLEEPRTGTFILTTSQPQKLLPTITSRCQIVTFTRLKDEEVISVLKEQQIDLPPELLPISLGSPGQAIQNFSMFSNIPSEVIKQLETPPGNLLTALQLSNQISSWGSEVQLWLLNYLEKLWWNGSPDTSILAKFSQARKQFSSYVNQKSVWDSLFIT
ncbi:MAG: AAA family ATPase [Scytonematopsis contorta HA4267-MV1]|jgi:DNA polymerase-3 subunit delta'|nr:AAA family ATPase [Scytonematopsis contorta HA4267-MV1]